MKNDRKFDKSIYLEKACAINSTWKGEQVGLPFNMEGRLMFYRKDIFKKEGLKVPTTLDEWVKVVQYFEKNKAKYPKGFYGATYMYGAEQGAAYPFEQYWGLFDWKKVKTENGFWDENFQNIMDEKLLVKSFKFWADIKKSMPPGGATETSGFMIFRNAFNDIKIGTATAYSWMFTSLIGVIISFFMGWLNRRFEIV
jgi:ABC-type glycerol-3-phosphate transport system substrate-binding protein